MSVTLWIESTCNSLIVNENQSIRHLIYNATHEAAYAEQLDNAPRCDESSKE